MSSGSQPTFVASNTNNVSPTVTSGGSGGVRKLVVGAQLQNGRYVVEDVLGEGGMGAAVRARDTRVKNKQVVIKELISDPGDPTQHQEDVRNFELEVETLADLDHPLVPSVTDSFQEHTHYFMVQDYVAGENLEKRMERVNQPMPEREALTYASQVLDILDYLSQQNPPLVHRDIKPANIIIGSKDKRARLVDFGIARAQANKNAKRQQTTALGTPGYAPPEQYQGNADERSDLYALAATLHHVLTNRDPRNYPPFMYPPARSINPKLTPDIERVLERALKINSAERYQSAAAMKHDIDDILARVFNTTSPMDAYTQNTSSNPAIPPTPVVRSTPPQQQQNQLQQQQLQRQRVQPRANSTPIPPVRTNPPAPAYPVPRRRSTLVRNLVLLIIVILLIGLVLFTIPRLSGRNGAQPIPTPVPTRNVATPIVPQSSTSVKAIGVTQMSDALVGISDGSYAFDTNRQDGKLKQEAADKFRSGDNGGALALLSQAVATESNDPEALIYQENLRIINQPHITLVAGSMPSGAAALRSVGHDDLQGAYVAQKEFNDKSLLPNGMKVRLLIASSGGTNAGATRVAQQLVQLAKTDKTFMGVMGWPYSNLAYAVANNSNVVQAKIPIVSETASSDQLSGVSPYFFHVNPTNKEEAIAGAKYAETTMKAKNVAVFTDNSDLYSQSLAQDFSAQFTADGGKVTTFNYTAGQASSLQAQIQPALQTKPDILYFAGHSSDIAPLLNGLQAANAPDSLRVLGGDALYELGGYAGAKINRLSFTAFSYPDEWDVLGLTSKKPAFFSEYANDFDPSGKHPGSPYGFVRPTSDVMLSYDATTALLKAYAAAAAKSSTVTFDDMKDALHTLTFQGVSGQIAFDQNGDPVDKAVVILTVANGGSIHMVKAINKFE
jgi:serine/threonine protein kinase